MRIKARFYLSIFLFLSSLFCFPVQSLENSDKCLLDKQILISQNSPSKTALIENVFKHCDNENSSSISSARFSQMLNNSIHDFEHNDKDSDHGHEHHEEEIHAHEHHEHHSHEKHVHLSDFFELKCIEGKFNNFSNVISLFPHINLKQFINLLGLLENDLASDCKIEKNLTVLSESIVKDKINKLNWSLAFLSAIIISIIGLLCYLVVPSIKTQFFNPFFQFLVALAVGTLSGDSLLHLIPHAFMGSHDHDESSGNHGNHEHLSGIFKGLSALVGIYLFFIIEKIMQIRRARKEKRHRLSELDAENEKLSVNNYSSRNEIKLPPVANNQSSPNGGVSVSTNSTNMTTKTRSPDEKAVLFRKSEHSPHNHSHAHHDHQIDQAIEDQSCYVIHVNKDLKYISQYLPNNKCNENVDHHDHQNETEHLHKHRPKIEETNAASVSLSILPDTKLESDNTQTKLLEDSPLIDKNCLCSSVPNLHETTNTVCLEEKTETPTKELSLKQLPEKRHKSHHSEDDADSDDQENRKHSHKHGHSHMHGHSHSSFHIYKTKREKAHHDHHKKQDRKSVV